MNEKQTLGIRFLGGLLTFAGGLTLFILIIEIMDSLRFSGLSSIFISNTDSLAGFVLYAGLPIIFYATGIGLFMHRPWTLKVVLFIIPPLTAFLAFSIACNLARERSAVYGLNTMHSVDLMIAYPKIFFDVFLIYLLFLIPLLTYFSRSDIKSLFQHETV